LLRFTYTSLLTHAISLKSAALRKLMKAHHTLALKVVNVLKDKFAKAYCVKTNRMKSTQD
jgi:hypothetical protein